MTQWKDISSASAVGKKRLHFMLANGKQVIGYRAAGSANVVPEFGTQRYLAVSWRELPAPDTMG